MNCTRLIFNRETNQLDYDSFKGAKNTALDLLIQLICYPGFIFMGAMLIAGESYVYFKYQKKQKKLHHTLTNEVALKHYHVTRIQVLDAKIAQLKINAQRVTQTVVATGCLGSIDPSSIKNWTPEDWKKFSATDIVALAARQLPAKMNVFVNIMEDFIYCDVYRRRIQALIAQKEALQTGGSDNAAARKIAQMSYVKTILKKQSALNSLQIFKWMLVPFVAFFKYPRRESRYFLMEHQGYYDRQTFENQQGDLTSVPSLNNKYADPVDAHNQLLKDSPYLVPYLT